MNKKTTGWIFAFAISANLLLAGTDYFDDLDVKTNITVGGTVDGRDIAVDGTKLDGIASGATADQTAAEVANTPAGNIAATNVQDAINELDTEKLAKSVYDTDSNDKIDSTAGGTNIDSSSSTGYAYVTAGVWSFLTPTLNSLSDVTITTPAQGDIIYYNGSSWVNLTAGASGTFLKSQGTGASIIWGTPAGAGDMLTNIYDLAGIAEQVLGISAIQFISNKTHINPKLLDSGADHEYTIVPGDIAADVNITMPTVTDNDEFVFLSHPQTLTDKTFIAPALSAPVLSGVISGASFLDEDDFASNSDTKIASQQSIKAYVDDSVDDYLPLAGGALTGALNMPYNTNINFATTGSAASIKGFNNSLDFLQPKDGSFIFRSYFSPAFYGTPLSINKDGIALENGVIVNTFETTLTDDDTHVPTSGAVYAKTVVSNTTKDCSSAVQTHTMPALSASIDGYTYRVGKYGQYKLTIQPANTTDSIGDSGDGYGIETLDSGSAFVTLLADNTNNKWHIIENSGRWGVEGLLKYIPMIAQSIYIPGTAGYGTTPELVSNDYIRVEGGALLKYTSTLWSAGANYSPIFGFNGTSQFFKNIYDTQSNVFASLTDSWTLSIMVMFNAADAGEQVIFFQYEDASNYWGLVRTNTETYYIYYVVGGVSQVSSVTLGGAYADTAWHQIDIVKSANKIAVYTDKVRGYHATIDTANAIAGSFYWGQSGGSTSYLDGSLSDFFIAQQNIYNADPTSASDLPASASRILPAKGFLIKE